jgi:GGDEF domain-containing protein
VPRESEGSFLRRWAWAPGIESARDRDGLASRLLDALREPYLLAGESVRASASIGVAVFPADGGDAETLVREADTALYCVKDLGRDRLEYSSREPVKESVVRPNPGAGERA